MASINLSPPSDPAPPASSPSSTSQRRALGDASTTTRTRSTRPSSTRTAPSPSGDVFSAPSDAPRPNGRIPVFVDPTGAEADPAEAAPWPELGTRKARVKENIPEVRKAAGTTLRQPRSARAGSTSAGASRIPVYRDPEPAPEGAPPGGKKGKSAIAVFRDEDVPVEGSGGGSVPRKEKGKSAIAVFRDEDAPAESSATGSAPRKEKGKSSIAVFRDEEESGATKHKKGKSSIAVFRDEDEGAVKKGKTKSSIDVFRDDDPGEKAVPAGKKHDKGKSSISVFRDEEPAAKARPVTPSTPGFTPYRDSDEVRRHPSRSFMQTLNFLILAGHSERCKCAFQRHAAEAEGSTRTDRGRGTEKGSVQELCT